jgi:signal transduction histidine kinase/CheY-like chemotaxis protein/HPt (histidine-containing phosphotransfer) domain-containing protein
MNTKKSTIPIKIIVSYLALVLLVFIVGWILYSENIVLSNTEVKINTEKKKILKIGTLLSNLYKTESFARQTIQSNSEKDFKKYIHQTRSINLEIDSLQLLVTTPYQIVLLDSVKYLLSKKIQNISQLKAIKNKANDEVSVKNAINNLTKMELSLSKLRIEDLVVNPSAMGSYQRNVLKKYVDYLNQNIPDDSTNTLSNKASDSILMASKKLLSQVKEQTEKRKKEASIEEYKLLENELLISEQLRKILNIIEREILINSTKNDFEKENSLKKTNRIITIAAIIGLCLAIFFSILILGDFSKTQSYKTQLEIANSKTKSLLKNREQLISTVSHDLKTPLSTIVGYTELLGHSELNKKQVYFTENIKNSSQYISKLVQDLLDFTQIEAGKITLDNIPFSIDNIVYEVAHNVKGLYPEKPIKLLLEIDEKLKNNCLGDPFRLRQVLTNIIGNAYKFTEKGFVKIIAKIDDNQKSVIITIEDSGIGIAQDKQELIFEEFTQADDTIEKKYGGTGLGLTISKKMMRILGGYLRLKSQLGKGSIFEIGHPLIFDTTFTKPANKIQHNTSLTAIIVDDDSNLLRLTTEVLKQHNYTVFCFTAALQAIEKIKHTAFDVLITDIQMPGIDGFELIKKIKEHHYNNQPIIAITGKSDIGMEIFKNAGFTQVIQKPYSPKILLELLDSIFDQTPIVKNIAHEPEIETVNDKLYSLASIKSFLPNQDTALKDVLNAFMHNTNQSLQSLEAAIGNNDSQKIKEISHRMCPMFKQIKAMEISQLLETLESEPENSSQNHHIYPELKLKIVALFGLFEVEVFS